MMLIYDTERLKIRPLVDGDAQAIFEYRVSPLNFPFVDMPPYTHLQESLAYIEKMNEGMAIEKRSEERRVG